MAAGEEKSGDFYAVLGLNKECTEAELRIAYKKLALKWHPDRCSALGNLNYVEQAKTKFQAIQEAYSVLSDANKRFLYDVGVYDSDDDDDENGMGDFLNEMAAMMSQNKPNEHEDSFEELQELFEELFQRDIDAFGSTSKTAISSSCSSSDTSCSESSNTANKLNSSEMKLKKTNVESTSSFAHYEGFCIGAEHHESFKKGKGAKEGILGGGGNRRRNGRKQKISSSHEVSVSFNDYSTLSA